MGSLRPALRCSRAGPARRSATRARTGPRAPARTRRGRRSSAPAAGSPPSSSPCGRTPPKSWTSPWMRMVSCLVREICRSGVGSVMALQLIASGTLVSLISNVCFQTFQKMCPSFQNLKSSCFQWVF